MEITHQLINDIIQKGIAIAEKRGFSIACAFVDGEGRLRGVIRHADALWVTPDFAVGKARLASAFRNSTGAMYARLQKERPLYGATIASLNSRNEWFLAEGGMSIVVKRDGKNVCLGAVGISGCFPGVVDQEVADELVAWIKSNVMKLPADAEAGSSH
jgi:uncharacterized protein GlcG (DUF336 family)